jgi:hypothetical protein
MDFKNIAHSCFLFLSISLLFVSCNLEETNASLTEVTEVNVEELLPAALTQMANNQSGYTGRSMGVFMRTLGEFDVMSVLSYSGNSLPPEAFNNSWNFGFYSASLIQARMIVDIARKEGSAHYEAIGKIILAHEFGTLTSIFGDIPFSQAVQGNVFPFPEYDQQKEVFEGVQQLLGEAITLIDQSSVNSPGGDDLLYSGNMTDWKKMAYALKARFLLYTSRKYPEHFSEVLDIVQNKTFSGVEEQAVFDWGTQAGADNPLYRFAVERPSTLTVGNSFANLLIENNDPRLDRIAVPNGSYWFYFDAENVDSLFWSRQDVRIPILSFSEIKFMEAEALLRTGGALEDISAALKLAIESSFVQMEMSPDLHQDFISTRSDLSGFSSEEEIIEHIMNEAYVCYYGCAFQQMWTNFRRLGYPELIYETYNSQYNPSGVIPERFLYPETERIYNSTNCQSAIERQNGALMDEPIWAFE